MIRGRRISTMAANPPHADQQSRLDYVLNAHAAPGFVVSAELLTRMGIGSDFATDVCIRREGIDPETGKRYLEELAFEVVGEQSNKDITEKAEDMSARGVRRVFAIFVKTGEVKEWRGAWALVDREIVDEALGSPLLVGSLSDAAAADDAVVRALDKKGNPAILRIRQEERQGGHSEGEKQALFTLLAARGFVVTPAVRARVRACKDAAELTAWIVRASTATRLDEVFPG